MGLALYFSLGSINVGGGQGRAVCAAAVLDVTRLCLFCDYFQFECPLSRVDRAEYSVIVSSSSGRCT